MQCFLAMLESEVQLRAADVPAYRLSQACVTVEGRFAVWGAFYEDGNAECQKNELYSCRAGRQLSRLIKA